MGHAYQIHPLNSKVLIILAGFILGGLAADSRPHKVERFEDIIRFPLFGFEDIYMKGIYFTKMRIGNPPQELTVIVDSGSDLFWVNCPGHDTVGSKSYIIDNSATASIVNCSHGPCTFQMDYIDNSSISGIYVRDALHYDAFLRYSTLNMSTYIEFGCSTQRNGVIKYLPKVEGILGLGPGRTSIISKLSSQQIIPPVFTHCLASRGDGFLMLGQVLDPGLIYIPIVTKSMYMVALESIAVNGNKLLVDPRAFYDTVIDSGTQRSTLEAGAYDLLLNTVSIHLNQSWYLGPHRLRCFQVSSSEKFPKVHFNFRGGATLILKPTDYLLQNLYDGNGGWCMGFIRDNGATILGAPVLSDKIVVYDLNLGRIGWADRDCSKPVNVSLTYDLGSAEPPATQPAASCAWRTRTASALMTAASIILILSLVY